MSADLIKRLTDELRRISEVFYPTGTSQYRSELIAEADAHLRAVPDTPTADLDRIATLERENAKLNEMSEEDDALRDLLSEKLARIAVAIKGEPPPLTLWGWHDLPELVTAMMEKHAEQHALQPKEPPNVDA